MRDTTDDGKIIILFDGKKYELNVRMVELEIKEDYEPEFTFGIMPSSPPPQSVYISAKLRRDENGYWGHLTKIEDEE